jgi:23S rRNA (guanosine2251-2'-O)-methyltransferase
MQPVREAIRVHCSRIERVMLREPPSDALQALERFARDQGVSQIDRLSERELTELSRGVSHQGAVAWAPKLTLLAFDDLILDPVLLGLVLDRIQDPQNFGAVVRSAVALAGAAVIWGENASAPLSTATFRASAGAIEHARLCRVRSLTAALGQATQNGAQVIGLDSQAAVHLKMFDLSKPTLLVLGSEHGGLARGVRRVCGAVATVAPSGALRSLNVSVAGALALYEAVTQREKSAL